MRCAQLVLLSFCLRVVTFHVFQLLHQLFSFLLSLLRSILTHIFLKLPFFPQQFWLTFNCKLPTWRLLLGPLFLLMQLILLIFQVELVTLRLLLPGPCVYLPPILQFWPVTLVNLTTLSALMLQPFSMLLLVYARLKQQPLFLQIL
jgi:hypothetical protein